MKKILVITILVLLVLSIPVIAGIHNNRRSSEKCTVRNCNIERYEDSPYCRYHKCGIFGCNSRRELLSGRYSETYRLSSDRMNLESSTRIWETRGCIKRLVSEIEEIPEMISRILPGSGRTWI